MESAMDYNELKELLLQLLSEMGPLDSNSIAKKLPDAGKTGLDIHAIRMALMRYYKQGLLKRQRAAGVYSYTLTERGLRRLSWLRAQSKGRS